MNDKRSRQLNTHPYKSGAVVHWMQREHRAHNNWSLLYAQELANRYKSPLIVVFCLRPAFQDATERLISFMFEGLQEVEKELIEKRIPFHFLLGDPTVEIPAFIEKHKAGALTTDFHSLRVERGWRHTIAKKIQIPFFETDARNIVPCWTASNKEEFAAYTFRPKLTKLLYQYLDPFDTLHTQKETVHMPPKIDWKDIYSKIQINTSIKKLDWMKGGTSNASKLLDEFIERKLSDYDALRNDPSKDVQSHLSPYLHFGHISSQEVVMELYNHKNNVQSQAAFIEEITVRRELADNYCFYNLQYDSFEGFRDWAKKSLTKHVKDRRDFEYSFEELAAAKTHDELWNAAQHQAVKTGFMHGWMRMYWAKKILEWTPSPDIAIKYAIRLMDLYFIDGRESNGFTGIAWSIGGVHDRAWFERPVFGQVRYMNLNGAKKKFDVNEYIEMISKI